MAIATYILIITLNVNGLNAPTKRHRLAEWIQKINIKKINKFKLIKINGEIKIFTDKQKLREFSIIKLALQQMLKRLL